MLLLVGAVLAAPDVRAQGGDAAAAEVLFREGREAADAGDHKKACEKFHESHRLDPAPGTMLNIADCEEKLGRLATAWTFYRAVAQKLPASDDRTTLAKSRAQALEPRLPKLTVRLAPGAPAGTQVLRDGVELKAAAFDTPLPVDPGKHMIDVSAPGRESKSYQLSLAEGEQATRVVEPGKASERTVEGGISSDRPPSGSGTRTLGWVLGGVGVAGIAVGAVTGVMVLDKKSVVDENCDAEKRCNADGADAAESGQTLGTISGVSFAVGAVALAAGAYFVLSSDTEQRPAAALAIGPGQMSYIRYW
jgi:hypothetical protein